MLERFTALKLNETVSFKYQGQSHTACNVTPTAKPKFLWFKHRSILKSCDGDWKKDGVGKEWRKYWSHMSLLVGCLTPTKCNNIARANTLLLVIISSSFLVLLALNTRVEFDDKSLDKLGLSCAKLRPAFASYQLAFLWLAYTWAAHYA